MIFVCAMAFGGTRGVEVGVAQPAGLDRAYASRRVALVVGIDVYDDPSLGDLRFAAKDAADMATVLRDPELGGYDVVSLVSGEVGRAAFWSAFRAIASTVQRDDTVVVYVAGHGTLDLGPGGTELFLLGSDATLSDAATTGIRVRELSDAVGEMAARRTALVLDTCYSGSGRSVLAPTVVRKLQGLRGPVPSPHALVVSEFSANLYAAHVNQPSIEDPSLANGVYTHFLVQALEGAGDADQDGLVEVMEAHAFARDRTLEYTGGSQVPWSETVSVGREALFLSGDPADRRGAESALLAGLEALPAGAVITVDGVARGAGSVAPGVRRIEVLDGPNLLLSTRFRVGPGDRIELSPRVSARRERTAVVVGGVGAADTDWLGRGGLSLALGYAPADPVGPRFEIGAKTTFTGIYIDGHAIPTGTLMATGAYTAGSGAVAIGPTLGAGLGWRWLDEPGTQAGPLVAPGVVARIGNRRMFGELAISGLLFEGNRALVAVPTFSVALGLHPGDPERNVRLP